jgi:hypothetical protein
MLGLRGSNISQLVIVYIITTLMHILHGIASSLHVTHIYC